MGILGAGVDVVRSTRLLATYQKHGMRFLQRYLHPIEMAQFQAIQEESAQMNFLATRWAVKEATYKAFKAWRIDFKEIQLDKQIPTFDLITNEGLLPPSIQAKVPTLAFHGKAQTLAKALHVTDAHVTLSHDGEYTIAYVILEKND